MPRLRADYLRRTTVVWLAVSWRPTGIPSLIPGQGAAICAQVLSCRVSGSGAAARETLFAMFRAARRACGASLKLFGAILPGL